MFQTFYPNETSFSQVTLSARWSNPSGNFLLINSYFSTESSGKGGAIFINTGFIKLLIELCVFNGCRSTADQAGAVYSYADNAEIVFNKVCAYWCYTLANQFQQFAAIGNSNFKTISCYLLSITKCSPFADNGYDVMYIAQGKQQASNVNTSNNLAYSHSGFCFYTPSELDAKYFNVVDNKAKTICIRFMNGHLSRKFYLSNVIGNNSPNEHGVAWFNFGDFFLEKVIFLNNQNVLFKVDAGMLFIYKCWISHTGTLTQGSNINFFQTGSTTNSHIIKMFASNACLAVLPFGSLDTHPYQTITSCPINSCHMIIHQSKLTILLSFLSLISH